MRFAFVQILAALFLLDEGRAAGLTSQQEKLARKMYVAKCAKCHEFYKPNNYNQQEWNLWMEKMSRKSRLKPEQQTLLTTYLEEIRTGARPHP